MSGGRLRLARVLAAFAGFSFLLHFVWEMLQSPLYSSLRGVSPREAVRICTLATAGDVGIALVAYFAGALAQRDELWLMRARAAGWFAYLAMGLAVTALFEYLGTGPLQRWTYASQMPTLPVVGTGLSPLLQWVLVPLLVIRVTARYSRA